MALAGCALYFCLRPSNNTTIEEVSGELVQNEALIDFKPEVDVDLHGDRCWAVITVLAITIFLILTAIALFPRLKKRRLKKKAAQEQLTLQFSALAEQSEEQKARAKKELALLKEASDRRMRALSVELDQLRGETHAVVAVHNSRNKVQP